MKGSKASAKGRIADPINPENEHSNVFSDIPWEQYQDKMYFSGKVPKGNQTTTRSINFDSQEMRLAECILEAAPCFQTMTDVFRDALRKGIQINYEIFVKRKSKIKKRADAIFHEIALADRQLEVMDCIGMVEERIKRIYEESKKGVMGKDVKWADDMATQLISTAEADYPNEGIQEHFDQLRFSPQTADTILFNINSARKLMKYK
jgi:hypothetical protein